MCVVAVVRTALDRFGLFMMRIQVLNNNLWDLKLKEYEYTTLYSAGEKKLHFYLSPLEKFDYLHGKKERP